MQQPYRGSAHRVRARLKLGSERAPNVDRQLCPLRFQFCKHSCSKPDIQGYYVALESLLKDYLRKCFHTNFSSSRVRMQGTSSISFCTCM